jgi:predicted outer membrane repeat protein
MVSYYFLYLRENIMSTHSIINLFYRTLASLILLALTLGVVPSQLVRAAPVILYVKPGSMAIGACDSWVHACELRYALGLAGTNSELWVAQGTYKPTSGSDQWATFHLKTGVGIYGGFVGTETNRNQRNWLVNITILSGDIGVEDDINDNSYHVVIGSGTDGSAILDGFTVTSGNANTNAHDGGGMYNISGSPSLANVIFDGNSADGSGGGVYTDFSDSSLVNITFISNTSGYGGGMFNNNSSPALANVIFNNNSATNQGGGMFNHLSSSTLVNVTFKSNSANLGGGIYNHTSDPSLENIIFIDNTAYAGGGMFNYYSNSTLVNATFTSNSATYEGGGIWNEYSDPSIHNSIFWDNNPDQIANAATSNPTITFSDLEGGCPYKSTCTNVIDADPLFVNPIAGDLRLDGSSPAIDAADNTRVPPDILDLDGDGNTSELLPYDLAGDPRFIDVPETPDTGFGTPPIVDMGVYEMKSPVNHAPVAVNDSYSMNEETVLTIIAPGILTNDTDVDSDPLTVILVMDVSHGTLVLSVDGSFTYTPGANFYGTDTYIYQATDGKGNSNFAAVRITVGDVLETYYLPIVRK